VFTDGVTASREKRKHIREKADLALFGAAPAFTEPVHVGRPNIGNREEFLTQLGDILERKWLTNNGPLVQEFEARIADYLGVRNCVAMCNGTIALEIAIRAVGLEGEVIVPSYTFVATAHALYWQGITPVFADINPDTHNLDPDAVRRMITPRTTGIIGVHLWGRPAPIEVLEQVAAENEVSLLFDAAHAFGCSHAGRMVGGFGRCEVLSFHATKFFNTFEGGAVVTNDDDLAEQMRLMRNFGFAGLDKVIHPGTNGKMIEVCAAMGLTNLGYVDSVVATNKRNYEAYRRLLHEVPGLSLLAFNENERNNYQYLVLEVSPELSVSRDDIVEALHAENVLARRYFWPGSHRMQPYRDLFPHAGLVLSNTEAVAERVIVLPTGTSVEEDDILTISTVIRTLINGS
jgi:dTDP-4-amino-4,6-dideoxygalactose transaminase